MKLWPRIALLKIWTQTHLVPSNFRGEMTIKLKVLFIVMDLLTFCAYPIVFAYGKLRQFSKPKERFTTLPAFLVGSMTMDRQPIR